MKVEEKEKWDCETILSTYSNLYNHPKVIEEPKVTIVFFLYKCYEQSIYIYNYSNYMYIYLIIF